MLFAVLFEDNPAAPSDVRALHMAAHLAFLEENSDNVRAAGPLSDTTSSDGAPPSGGLWLVDAGSAEEVEALVHADPFWPTGLRRSVRILAWRQVFSDGKRQI